MLTQDFKAGKSPIMLATDVAARGLGVPLGAPFPSCMNACNACKALHVACACTLPIILAHMPAHAYAC